MLWVATNGLQLSKCFGLTSISNEQLSARQKIMPFLKKMNLPGTEITFTVTLIPFKMIGHSFDYSSGACAKKIINVN